LRENKVSEGTVIELSISRELLRQLAGIFIAQVVVQFGEYSLQARGINLTVLALVVARKILLKFGSLAIVRLSLRGDKQFFFIH